MSNIVTGYGLEDTVVRVWVPEWSRIFPSSGSAVGSTELLSNGYQGAHYSSHSFVTRLGEQGTLLFIEVVFLHILKTVTIYL
jgi:hypothetical protein